MEFTSLLVSRVTDEVADQLTQVLLQDRVAAQG